MSRSRTKRSGSEHDLVDKLKHENQKLKRQISQLRKQLSRLDLNKYANLKELVDKQELEDKHEEKQKHQEQVKKLWECFECRNGHLLMLTFERRDGVFYYRKCNSCGHRTQVKKLTADTQAGPTENNNENV
jgi:hypothetical protein